MAVTLRFSMPMRARILVGAFGSNAYVTPDRILHFASELTPVQRDVLRVLVAHEMGHAFHYALLGVKVFSSQWRPEMATLPCI